MFESSKLVREIDGHKFFSGAYDSKDKATANAKEGFTAVYESETKAWYNMSTLAGINYQEDIHTAPKK